MHKPYSAKALSGNHFKRLGLICPWVVLALLTLSGASLRAQTFDETVTVNIAADDQYRLYLNGSFIGNGNLWRNAQSFSINVKPGDVIAVEARDAGFKAGLIADIVYEDGQRIVTDTTWKVSEVAPEGWNTREFNDDAWSNASEYGFRTAEPWRGLTSGLPTGSHARWIWTASNETDGIISPAAYFRFTLPDSQTLSVRTIHQSLVSETASFNTPRVVDGRVEAIEIEGDTVFVGGTFTQIQSPTDGQIIDQAYLFAYNKSTGAIIRDFDPQLDRPVVALQTTGEGTGIFAGGAFTMVNGEGNRRGLVKLDDFGDRVPEFSARINRRVLTMDRSGNTLYIGGNFNRVSSQSVEYLAAIDTVTGALLPNINLDFDGFFSTFITNGSASVDDIEVTSDNQLMVVVGNFMTINGFSRSRIALLELGDQAVVSNWNTDVFDIDCPAPRFPQYIKGLDMAPDNSYFVTATAGFRRLGEITCDSVLRFNLDNLNDPSALPTWASLTGGDAAYEVAVAEHAIYVGGHFRWLNNDLGGDDAGPGSVQRRGLAVLDPLNGLPVADWRSDRNPRGIGTFALELRPEGLYIGDDTNFLKGFDLGKFKFLPITSDVIARPTPPSLPTMIISGNFNTLEANAFDGSTLGTAMQVSDLDDWSNTRGAMFLGGKLFHAGGNGGMWVSSLRDDNTFGARRSVDLRGLSQTEWDLSRLGGMFFDHEQGRVYYTLENESQLLWRAFTPDGSIFGVTEHVAEVQGDIPWSDVQGMDVVDDQLYFIRTDGNLYRTDMNGASPVAGTTVAITGAGIDEQNWNRSFLAFSADGAVFPQVGGVAEAKVEFESAGSVRVRSFRRFEFAANPGEPINVRLSWDNPDARINVFLRDPDGKLVDSNNDQTGSSPKWLFAPAGSGGTYTVSLKIQQGATEYIVSVNPPEAPPEPRADIEFSSFGSVDTRRWQVFNFDVEAGDLVDVQVQWPEASGSMRVFLRDESRKLIDRDIDFSGSPATVSAIAQTTGRWSVAVRIETGAIEYDVLVNTSNNNTVP